MLGKGITEGFNGQISHITISSYDRWENKLNKGGEIIDVIIDGPMKINATVSDLGILIFFQ